MAINSEGLEALVEKASAAYAEATDYYVPFHAGLSSASADKIRKGIRAALKASLPTPVVDEGLENLLDDLQQAEAEYRLMHDRHGDGNLATGRAWDRMRRMGDKARDALDAKAKSNVS